MNRHRHECACGDFFMCSQSLDHCDIRHWDCPHCELRALDAYFSRLATATATEPQPTSEDTHHEKH